MSDINNDAVNGVSVVGHESSSDDDTSLSMKIVEKATKVDTRNDDYVDDDSDVENDHSAASNNGFGADGEPDYKPRKVKSYLKLKWINYNWFSG